MARQQSRIRSRPDATLRVGAGAVLMGTSFRSAAARELAARVRLDRFSFDVELLFVAHRRQLRIVECPVLFLYRKEPTTVRFARDSWAMLRDMLRIRVRSMRGVYERAPGQKVLQDLWQGGAAAGGEPVPWIAPPGASPRRGIGQTG